MIRYRLLSRLDIPKFVAIDRKQTIDAICRVENGDLIIESKLVEISDWSLEEKQQRITSLEKQYDRGATCFGAFVPAPQSEATMVGLAVLSIFPIKSGQDRFNLAGLWVSAGYRGKGVGGQLVRLALREARVRGAKSIYVSATPTEPTVRFYQSIGFQLTDLIDPGLFALEPEDIHMEIKLM